jgi:hypothetical protein
MSYWHTHQLYDHNFLGLIDGPAQRSVIKTLAERIQGDGSLKMSQKTLAKLSAESSASVYRALDQAEALGLITRHREGRRKAERIVWHACPPDCSEKTHTGKNDTSKPVLVRESTADHFPKPAKRRRKPKPSFTPKETATECSQTDDTETSQTDEKSPVIFTVTTLKDNPSLNTDKGISETSQTDDTESYVSLVQAAEALSALADIEGHTPLTVETEVLLDLLNDNSPQALRVAALAVELWGHIPQPFTHDHSEQLNTHASDVAGINTLRLYKAIIHYTRTQTSSQPWRTLSKAFKAGYVDDYTRKTVAQPIHMSPVADSVEKMHTGKQFGQLFTPAPVDDLMARLSALSPE